MAYPPGISLAVIQAGKAGTFFGDAASLTATVTPVLSGTKYLVHQSTGDLMVPSPMTFTAADDSVLSFSVPHVDQPGYLDDNAQAYTMWAYKVDVTVLIGNGRAVKKHTWTKNFQHLVGQDFIDIDQIASGVISEGVTAPLPEILSVNGQTGHVVIDSASTITATETEPGVYVVDVS